MSYGKAISYLPVIDLLRAYCRIEARDDARTVREKLTGKILTLDESLRPSLPAFFALLDVPVEDPTWDALDPPRRRHRTLDALKRLLLRESQEQPLLVVFEDLHWIDAETHALLDRLVESLPTARLLLLVNYRPEYSHEWGGKSYYAQLRIDPLPPESAEELLDALLGDSPSVRPLKRHLIERTGGNPFFLEESVRTLIETGALAGERGRYRLTKNVTGVRVPATVQAILAARIDRLPTEDKRLLQTAAVVGKDVPLALLQAIADLPEAALHDGLTRLQAAEFLYEAALFPEPEYTFKHALTHEVAYGSLLAEWRRALHARIVEAIEVRYPDRLAEQVERLAHHALRGEVWDKALPYLRQAGAKDFARSANREAAAYFGQALGVLEHLPQSRDMLEQAIDLRLDLRSALWPLAEFGRILEYLREAEALGERLGDQRRLGRVSSLMAGSLWQAGDHGRAIESGRRSLVIATALGDLAIQASALLYLGWASYALGDYPQAIEAMTRNIASLESDLVHERLGMPGLPSIVSRQVVAWCLAETGAFAEGAIHGAEAVRIAEATNQPYSLIVAHFGVGQLCLRKGDLDRAVSRLQSGLQLCEAAGMPLLFPLVAAPLGTAYLLSGCVAEARLLLERVLEEATKVGKTFGYSLAAIPLAEAYLSASRIEDARDLAGRALDLTAARKERGQQAWALRLLGEIAARHDPPDIERAEGYYRQALTLAEGLGMRPLRAHCQLGLGSLYRKTGRLEQARSELASAVELYSSTEMALWLPQAQTELAEVTTSSSAPTVT